MGDVRRGRGSSGRGAGHSGGRAGGRGRGSGRPVDGGGAGDRGRAARRAARLRRPDAAPVAGPAAGAVRRGPGGAAGLRARPRRPATVHRDVEPAHRHRARAVVTRSDAPSTPEQPWPVRTVARKINEWINRLGAVWVEGQITQVSARPGTATAFLTLRDPSADMLMSLTSPIGLVRGMDPPLTDGSRVVVHGKPTF